ncbi:hypothetical protein [Rhizobium oryzicola]|uniref:Uncharacterized protein n=1 Tax=Rhizobium oryzicola TaxID=1232668 RepID=A0ABT8SVT5_9HYPH|nr:hypothetical protein [Rhizobium oryzicola]MDO1581812.1 hypothetical protein [Rhizobium oryzicola]
MKYPTSREYKMMLKADAFVGNEAESEAAVGRFWQALANLPFDKGIAFGKAPRLDAKRDVLFLDTPEKALFLKHDLVFRLRRKRQADGAWDATLKFRLGDQLLAGAQTFRPRKAYAPEGRNVKFEEDVKAVITTGRAAFWALFSRSANTDVPDRDSLRKVSDLKTLYGRLPEAIDDLQDHALSDVNDLEIVEHVYDSGKLTLSGQKVEAAVILWWSKHQVTAPIAAEFSYRFDLDDGEAPLETVESAWALLKKLPNVEDVDAGGPTKTAIVYGAGQD